MITDRFTSRVEVSLKCNLQESIYQHVTKFGSLVLLTTNSLNTLVSTTAAAEPGHQRGSIALVRWWDVITATRLCCIDYNGRAGATRSGHRPIATWRAVTTHTHMCRTSYSDRLDAIVGSTGSLSLRHTTWLLFECHSSTKPGNTWGKF
jgi:hypothetical protein